MMYPLRYLPVCDPGANVQVMYLPDSFNPFTMATAKPATAKVYDYAEETLRGLGEYDTSQVCSFSPSFLCFSCF